MIKFFILTILSLTLGCTTTKLPKNEPNLEEYSKLKYSPIVRLHDIKDRFFCSATVISRNYAVTAAHCVAPLYGVKNNIIIHGEGNEDTRIVATTANYDGQMDFALITGDFSKFNSIQVEDETTRIVGDILSGERTIMCGFPNGGRLTCSPFSQIYPFEFGFVGQGILYPGMSGGPVISVGAERVVGVNTGMMQITNGAFITPLVEIFKALGVDND